MKILETPQELLNFKGKTLGTSDWLIVEQAGINDFADATDDHQWIHIDEERAAAELPGGRTIAHGILILSMLPKFFDKIFQIKNLSHGLVYGFDKIRFITPVLSNSKIRLKLNVGETQQIDEKTVRITYQCTVDVENQEKPAIIAEFISQYQAQ
jgi:acyl dehydratase